MKRSIIGVLMAASFTASAESCPEKIVALYDQVAAHRFDENFKTVGLNYPPVADAIKKAKQLKGGSCLLSLPGGDVAAPSDIYTYAMARLTGNGSIAANLKYSLTKICVENPKVCEKYN